MTPPKAIFLALLGLATMSTAGYVAADFALQADVPGESAADERRLVVAGRSLPGDRTEENRSLAAVATALSPTATVTVTVESSPIAAASPAETPAAPLPPASDPPPTATAVPPTSTPLPPTATPPPSTPLPPTATPPPPTPLPPTPVPPTSTPLPPTATLLPPTPTPIPPTPVPLDPSLRLGQVTPYHDSLAGLSLGCNGYGAYDPANPEIVAVGPDRYEDWPCGTRLGIYTLDPDTGLVSSFIVGVRQDSCPGCVGNHLDVSRAAFEALCGVSANRCTVVIAPLP